MKKEDIILKTGDKVYYTEVDCDRNGFLTVSGSDGSTVKEFEETYYCKVTKVEKQYVKYKTIYEAPTPILDKEEKEYLEAVVRPFKSKVKFIVKKLHSLLHCTEFLAISLGDDSATLPDFEEGTMYKGMKQFKHYTLEELGLFEEEQVWKKKK